MKNNVFEWTVIGGGPAGLLSVGKLLDNGVLPESIAWVDPHFKVGDLGSLWRNVPSNTKVHLFLQFLEGCRAFQFKEAPDFSLLELNPSHTCQLHHVADPLQWVSDHLKKRVQAKVNTAKNLSMRDRAWHVALNDETLISKNVVLAVGSQPKVLSHLGPQTVSLVDALDTERLKTVCDKDDVVAVFGSSHSAILVLKHLIELGVSRVINFYKSPLKYAIELDEWILFDNTGLKGKAADWARDNLDGRWPETLERVISSEESITQHLPDCNKVVYAVGFERRHLPVISGIETVEYNAKSGIIAPGLFGIGVAFPECRTNPIGIDEYSVGLWKFMTYIDRILPIWLKYGT